MRSQRCFSVTTIYGALTFQCQLKVLHDGDHEYEITPLQKLVWHKFHRTGRSKP